MKIVHRVAAYDRETARLVRQIDLSGKDLRTIFAVAHVPASYKTTFGSFPLDASAIEAIDAQVDIAVPVDWFLEASAVRIRSPGDVREEMDSGVDP